MKKMMCKAVWPLIVAVLFVNSCLGQERKRMIRKAGNVSWELLSVRGEVDSKQLILEMLFTNTDEIDKTIEALMFTVGDDKGRIYRPELVGDYSWIFPSGYAKNPLLSGVPLRTTVYVENFPPSVERLSYISLSLNHYFIDKPGTPNGQPRSNLIFKNITILWE